jgi:chromosome partitioning protein
MGKIILFGGEKGGTGKSTLAENLAAHLACEGVDVMLLDADKQGTSTQWIGRRNEAGLPAVHSAQKQGDVYKTALDLSERYDVVIIDAGGRDSMELRSAMLAADIMYVPIKASQNDLETLPKVEELVQNARIINPTLKVRCILSMAPTNTMINEVEEARALLVDFETFEMSDCIIRERKVFRDAAPVGKGVVEMDNSTAKAEIQLLADEVFE